MTIGEVQGKLAEMVKDGSLTDQTVEFVIDTQKYFIETTEKNTDKLTLLVTRKCFRPTTHSEFSSLLSESHNDSKLIVKNSDKGSEIEVGALHLGALSLELTSAPEPAPAPATKA